MSREIEADYDEQFLFPPALEQWVGPAHPVRFIREFVRELADEIKEPQQDDPNGRPRYGFKLLLSVWLYAYLEGITSSRQVAKRCREHVPTMWLAGLHEPDHHTLWLFWSRHRDEIRKVYLHSLRVAVRANLVGMVLHALDGTKIASRASRRSAWHEEDLKKMLALAEERIKRLEEKVSQAAEEGVPDDELPKQLQSQQALQQSIRESLKELEQSGEKHLQPNDRESRLMIDGRGRTGFSYNAQAVVDAKSGIIVAADVTDEPNDQHQLAPMLEQVKENVGDFAETTLADSGYDTAEGLGKAEEMSATVLVAAKVSGKTAPEYHASRFRYDEERDAVECPRGEWLTREGTKRSKQKPHAMNTYRCKVMSCPVRSACSSDRKGRLIEISPYQMAVQRQREKRHSPDARDLMRKRSAIAERPFAEIKEHRKFRRWTVATKAKVKVQWDMICTAMNLKRLIAALAAPNSVFGT